MMNHEPVHHPSEQERNHSAQQALKKIWKVISNQWGWKLVSIILAIFLWGGLISQDTTLPREKSFTNVKVNIINASTLRSNGLIVVDGLDELEAVNITVQVPQRYYNSVTANYYNVRLDLSQIKSAGKQTVKLTGVSTNSSLYGTVTEISVPQLTVEVEEYATRTRIPVQLQVTGEAPCGFFADSPSADPGLVDIAGPKSVVDSVVRCVAQYDQSMLTATPGRMRTSVPFVFQDRQGNILDDSNLTVTSQSVTMRDLIVEQDLYPTTTVPISTENLIMGQPAEGYRVTEVSIYPESIEIAASDLSGYQQEGALIFPYSRLNITGDSQGITGELSLRRPTNVVYMSAYEVSVRVKIEPIQEAERAE